MKKKVIASLCVMSLLLLSACSSSTSDEKEAKKKMEEGINYYSDQMIDKIPEISAEKDIEEMTKELESTIEKSKDYVDLYMSYMDNDELPKDYQDAAMNLKTAYYGIQTTALEPMLEIMKTNSGEAPDYPTLVFNAKESYVDKAEELLE